MGHRISSSHLVYAFDRTAPPVAQVDPGEGVIFETLDTSSGVIKSRKVPHGCGPGSRCRTPG